MSAKKKNSNKEGFKTPESYFENFDENLFERISLDQTIPDSDGFRIPNNYFDDFNEKVINTQNKPKVVNLFSSNKIYYILSTAAAILILFISIKSIYFNTNVSFDTLDLTEIENYIDTESINLDSEQIIAAFDTNDFNEIDFSENLIEEDELLEYLDKNIENYETLEFNL